MRILSFLILGLGLALAGGGVYYANELNKAQRASAMRLDAMVSILVASKALPANHVIRPSDLAWQDWPTHLLPPGAFTRAEDFLGDNGELTRIVKRSMDPGEPVIPSKIYGIGEARGVDSMLPPGWRATSIRIDAESGVSGFIVPGNRVDVLLTHTVQGKLTNQTVLTGVEVLAVDQDSGTESGAPRLSSTVTLKVTVEQAQEIDLARALGRLSLTLRGEGETATTDEGGVINEDSLPGLESTPKPKEKFIWLRRGGELIKVPLLE